MVFPAYQKEAHCYVCVLSETRFISIEMLTDILYVACGDNKNTVNNVLANYQTCTQKEFDTAFKTATDHLTIYKEQIKIAG